MVSLLMAGAILTMGLGLYASALSRGRARAAAAKQKVLAAAAASELTEFFRSLSTAQLNNYLQTNPATGSTLPANRYDLCSAVNLIDPTMTTVFHPDPLADVGPNTIQMSRFYTVRVVDSLTLAPRPAACGTKAPYNFAANPNDRFMVSVRVSWIPHDGVQPESLTLSTLIP